MLQLTLSNEVLISLRDLKYFSICVMDFKKLLKIVLRRIRLKLAFVIYCIDLSLHLKTSFR
jgi:hypothetical protein